MNEKKWITLDFSDGTTYVKNERLFDQIYLLDPIYEKVNNVDI